ncbi:hypothetical protein [Edaphovirga cremea]|uniref:hypothetical protein n=1 Tax=Edaphovirga cremea TaxID=2267246 RepID=UPI00398A2B2F
MNFDEAPNFLQAAGAHDIAADNSSVFDDITTAIGNAPSFLSVSIASGLNSFYNTGVSVANIFEGEDEKTQQRDTGEWISSYDDDLGKYYEDNKSAADLAGFIGTSIIPGLAGVKALKAGQSALRVASAGEFGSNMRWATNLLAPTMETYVKREATDLAAKSATFSFGNANALKALASGTQQGILESLAFETAVAATMFKSPILEDMDFGDIVKNVAFGTLIGGGIGAIGSAAGTYFGVKRLVAAVDARQVGAVKSTQLSSSAVETNTSDRIVAAATDREILNQSVTPEMVLAKKVSSGETGASITPDAVAAETAKANRLRLDNIQKLDNEIRTNIRKIAGEDTLGNDFADIAAKLGNKGTQDTFLNLKTLTRVAEESSVQTRVKALVKEGLTLGSAKKAVTDEAFVNIRMHSGDIGETIAGTVGVPRLADKYTPAQIQKLAAKARSSVNDATDFRVAKNARDIELRWYNARSMPLPLNANSVIGTHDLPFIDKAIRDKAESITIGAKGKPMEQRTLVGQDAIKNYFQQAKAEVIEAQKGLKHPSNFIELASDVRKDFIEGAPKFNDPVINYNAQASYAQELSQFVGKEISPADLHLKPRFGKATYDTTKVSDEDGHLLQGMALIKYREKMAVEATNKVFASFAGELAETFPSISEDMLRSANRSGGGAGTFTNAGGAYGSLEQTTSYIGSLTSELTRTRINKLTDQINPVAVKLQTNPEAAVKFSTLNELIASTPEKFVLNDVGNMLIPQKIRDYQRALDEGTEMAPPQLFRGTPEEIPLDSPELLDAVKLHIALNGTRNQTWKELNAVQGNTDQKALDVFQVIRPNPRDYRHIAFVKDETLVGVGHTRMLFANTSKELEDQIAKVPAEYKVYTKGQAEEFYNAKGEWVYDKTLHDNYVDHDLLSRGISSRFFPQTDPEKIVNGWLQDHVAKENTLIKQMVLAKYEKETNELKRLGDQFTNVAGSKTGKDSVTDVVTSSDKNPYLAQVKAMLNITKTDEVPLLNTLNQSLDRFVSRAWNKATDIFNRDGGKFTEAKSEEINNVFEQLGFKTAYYDAATNLMANSPVPRGTLTSFIRKSNAFLTTTILRLDPFNALNNLLGNSVLFSSELKSLTGAIEKGSVEGAGDLAKIMKMNIPGVEGDLIRSPSKLIANSLARLHGEGSEALRAEYKLRGLMPDLSDQYYKSLDAMTLTGKESVHDMSKKSEQLSQAWESFGKFGEKWTGNRWTEQFNRLISADVMKQITEVGVKHGVIDDKIAWAYVNTFVGRVNGVIRAAERPLMFQGPVGQAIGLFQSYQFNLMQQMFRYIGEGNTKAVIMAGALQGSVYGASSLPGFNLINSSLVGNAGGNPEHKDLYSATNTLFGKSGADWLMFGAPSNILRASLFTRGDTNPRTWSIVPNPTNPGDIPFISAFSKVFSSTKDSLSSIAGGAPVWNSFLNGIEHMGLSRPLAGMAQTARAFTNEDGKVTSTQANGTIVGTNDLVSLATLTRIAGAKPIDEAITSNAYFRVQSYITNDRAKREKLGTNLKLAVQGGNVIDGNAIGEFAQRYVELGGKQKGFNSWVMEQYKNTDRSRAEALATGLNSSYSRYMQDIMGGRDSLQDTESF